MVASSDLEVLSKQQHFILTGNNLDCTATLDLDFSKHNQDAMDTTTEQSEVQPRAQGTRILT